MSVTRISRRRLAFYSAILLSTALSHAQQTYLRIIDLTPIGSPPLDLYCGDEKFLAGMNSGFFRTYLPLDGKSDNRFTLRDGKTTLGAFEVTPQSDKYYTAVIYQDTDSQAKIALLADELRIKTDRKGKPVVPQPKRLRIYMGGYDFPLRLTAANLGPWETNGKMLFADIEIPASPPDIVTLQFVDKYGQPVRLPYPTDFRSGNACSVFVSQRGKKRPRIFVYADNVAPGSDPEAAQTSTPISTPQTP